VTFGAPVQRVIDSYHGIACTYVRPADAPQRPSQVCGEIHERCRGHTKDSRGDQGTRGNPCRSTPMVGQLVCYKHGGNTPQAKAGAQQRIAAIEAEKVLKRRLGDIDNRREIRDPTIALARLAGELEQAKDAALDMVAELDSPLLVSPAGYDIHPYVKLYERLVGQYRGLLVDMAKVDIGDRIANVEEITAQLHFAAVLAALADAGVDSPAVRAAIAARLRALPAEGVET